MAKRKPPDDQPQEPPPHPEEGNVGFLCDKHKRTPDPKFKELPLDWFQGKFCQLRVVFDGDKGENLWFKVVGLAEHPTEELRGELHNYPVFVDMQWGDLVEFSRTEILQVTDSAD